MGQRLGCFHSPREGGRRADSPEASPVRGAPKQRRSVSSTARRRSTSATTTPQSNTNGPIYPRRITNPRRPQKLKPVAREQLSPHQQGTIWRLSSKTTTTLTGGSSMGTRSVHSASSPPGGSRTSQAALTPRVIAGSQPSSARTTPVSQVTAATTTPAGGRSPAPSASPGPMSPSTPLQGVPGQNGGQQQQLPSGAAGHRRKRVVFVSLWHFQRALRRGLPQWVLDESVLFFAFTKSHVLPNTPEERMEAQNSAAGGLLLDAETIRVVQEKDRRGHVIWFDAETMTWNDVSRHVTRLLDLQTMEPYRALELDPSEWERIWASATDSLPKKTPGKVEELTVLFQGILDELNKPTGKFAPAIHLFRLTNPNLIPMTSYDEQLYLREIA